MDRNNTIATTVSIRNGRFVAVGDGAPVPRSRNADHRPEGAHGGARHHRQPQPHRADGQSPRLPHAARERLLDSRRAGDRRRARRRASRAARGSRRSAVSTGTSWFRAGRDAAAADAGGARRGGAEQSRVHLGVVQRALGHEQSRARSSSKARRPPIPVGADGSIAAGAQATGRATLVLRQTLLTLDQRKRGAIDALAYGLSLGVTTHLDQGAFQATNTPNDGAAHEDNYAMNLPFLALHARGQAARRGCGSTSSTRTRRPTCRR